MMSDEDDAKDLMSKAFAIDHYGEEFDLDIPPTSGMEYLRRVQLEAKQCPAIVVSDIDANSYQEQQTFKVSATSGLHQAPNGYAPTIKWQRDQTAKFSSIRQSFTRIKTKMRKDDKINTGLPNMNNVEAWCELCFGYLRPLRPTFPAPESHMADMPGMEPDPSSTEHRGSPPLLSIVASMDQPTVIQVLEYHINWFEATGFTQEQGRWFYALLTCLEKPLDPESCALLRNLARNCANLRASLETSSDARLAALNLLICLVARYFDQSDLADR